MPLRVCNGASSNPTIQQWFNTSCFVAPPKYTFGNSGRGILRGPGAQSWDIGLDKAFHTFESQYLQFRGEFFNAFNHANFGQPNNLVGVPGTGQISGAAAARVIQFVMKYNF